jgi:hypothetical protein
MRNPTHALIAVLFILCFFYQPRQVSADVEFKPLEGWQDNLELFYRWQLTPRFALTGDYQYLKDPALNPAEDSIHTWAVRGRFAL